MYIFRPDVSAVVHGLGTLSLEVESVSRRIFPSDIESFVKITAISRVGVLFKQSGVSFEVRALVNIMLRVEGFDQGRGERQRGLKQVSG